MCVSIISTILQISLYHQKGEMNNRSKSNGPCIRRHNSCVEFTFISEISSTNSYKLTRLNNIFEKAVDRRLGGIQEEKLIRILPINTLSDEKAVTILRHLGINSGRKDNRKSNGIKKKNRRVISRGPFLASFAYESVSFLNTLALNEKSDREKRSKRQKHLSKILNHSPIESSSDTSTIRKRANSAPSSSGPVTNGNDQFPVNMQENLSPKSENMIASKQTTKSNKSKQKKEKSKSKSRRSRNSKRDSMNVDSDNNQKLYPNHLRGIKSSSSNPNKKSPQPVSDMYSDIPLGTKGISTPLADLNINILQQQFSNNEQVSYQTMPTFTESSEIKVPAQHNDESSPQTENDNISYCYSSSSSESAGIESKKIKNKKKREKDVQPNKDHYSQSDTTATMNPSDSSERQSKNIYQDFDGQGKYGCNNRAKNDDGMECAIFQQVSSFLSKLFPPRGSAVVGIAPSTNHISPLSSPRQQSYVNEKHRRKKNNKSRNGSSSEKSSRKKSNRRKKSSRSAKVR